MEKNKNSDNKPIPLRPRARILRTLGDELISSETVALIELVKNAYDADAKNVLISFEGQLQEGTGSVAIMDDGHGMDMDTIINSWMIIGTLTKKQNRKSKSGRRRVLGEKGIGRFAVSRIANELELYTRTDEQSTTENYAVFDWTQFDNEDLFLDEVLFLADEQEASEILPGWKLSKFADKKYKPPFHGTLLKMNGLKRNWEKENLAELQRGLSRLISPFKIINDFSIYLDLPEQHNEYTTKISAPEIIKYPHYKVEGSVSKSGLYKFSVSVETDSQTTDFSGYYHKRFSKSEWIMYSSEEKPSFKKDDNSHKSIECGPFSFELRVWDRDELENIIQKVGGGISPNYS